MLANKFFKNGLIFLSLIIFNLLFSFFLTEYLLSGKQTNYIQENNIIHESCEQNITREIELIARNVSQNHKYILNQYDCTEFSKELVNRLKYINVSAYCVYGYVKGEYKINFHTWTETIINNQTIPIESTGGYFIDNETYQKYKILNKGFCL